LARSFNKCLNFGLNLQIIIKRKHPTKGDKKAQDERTQVLANEESSKDGGLLREWEQIKYSSPPWSQ